MTADRILSAKVLTQAGWLAGSLRIHGQIRLYDFFNRGQSFLPFTDVFLEAATTPLPFFALQRSAIVFIIAEPGEVDRPGEDLGFREEHEVSCLVRMGYLHGKVRIRAGFRLSDYLRHQGDFIPLTECTYSIRDPWSHKVYKEYAPAVLLNADALIGISEAPPEALAKPGKAGDERRPPEREDKK